MDPPYNSAAATFSTSSSKVGARRLRRTQQHLGSYRHDLLVAMRVVDSIEREMMQAEWENWLVDENTKCKNLAQVMTKNQTGSSRSHGGVSGTQQNLASGNDHDRFGKVRVWLEEYCGSCNKAQGSQLSRHVVRPGST